MRNTILTLLLLVVSISCKTANKKEIVTIKKEKSVTIAPVSSVPADDQDSPQITLATRPAKMEDFDFLIGNWTATSKRFLPEGTVKGEYKGKWEAQLLDEGRMIFDLVTWFNMDGTKESFFPTLRTFSPKTNQWEMTFISSLSYMHSQTFRGNFVDGEGYFDAIVSPSPGTIIKAKIRFYDITKNSFEWSMKFSDDEGENWFVAERITAKRVR
ncbi:hypothetical protein L3049_16560 [Labilibaculum sp. DW002]|uniref:DUF1579 domain-containing protein n=1 Tax=Paralabilibaculum antarcticum TaxID=2912572 RepID=A0ABT5VW06_9BACT|nr:hypothetical protein [Labilibaculum sp. DW002]MDE5419605.1 hypothetical protein [Labilibaculum sp. DW002]